MPKVWGLVEVIVPGSGTPEHPIVLPPEGPGTEPPVDSGAHPEHPIYYPPVPTHPIYLPPYPEHPIVLPPEGERPPGTWGGAGEPFPTPPIELPDGGGETPPEEKPPGTWGGAGEPFPTPPIVIVPPQGELPEIPEGKWLVVVYDPESGDMKWALVPAGGPPGNMPPAVQPV